MTSARCGPVLAWIRHKPQPNLKKSSPHQLSKVMAQHHSPATLFPSEIRNVPNFNASAGEDVPSAS